MERHLQQTRRILRTLGRWCHDSLTACGVDVVEPHGAFYLFPDFEPLAGRLRERSISSAEDLCRHLLDEAGVAAIPGSEFGRPPSELSIRIAYVNFDGGRALAAAESVPPGARLSEGFLRNWCSPTLEAIERLCGWLSDISR